MIIAVFLLRPSSEWTVIKMVVNINQSQPQKHERARWYIDLAITTNYSLTKTVKLQNNLKCTQNTWGLSFMTDLFPPKLTSYIDRVTDCPIVRARPPCGKYIIKKKKLFVHPLLYMTSQLTM